MRHAIDALRREARPAELAGSLLAAPADGRRAYAGVLANAGAWLHVDLIDDAYPLGAGVSEALLPELVAHRAPVDVHLLVREPRAWLPRVIEHRPDRVTVQLETLRQPWTPELERLRALCRVGGAELWAGLAPGTQPVAAAEALAVVDGVLVMLAEPGRPGTTADPRMVDRLAELPGVPRGVDGGVTEGAFEAIRDVGGSYIVMGRRLWSLANQGPVGGS
jgi:pentose-5-phosphate-3-epimerase